LFLEDEDYDCSVSKNYTPEQDRENKQCGIYDDIKPKPFCTYGGSFLRVYTMFLGEIDSDDFPVSNGGAARIFLGIFMFVMVILLANVLIAIVTDSYKFIQDREKQPSYFIRTDCIFWQKQMHLETFHAFGWSTLLKEELSTPEQERPGKNFCMRLKWVLTTPSGPPNF
jgi:hypothetical protein